MTIKAEKSPNKPKHTPPPPTNSKTQNKTQKLEEAEGIETIRHSEENMGELRLKIEAMPCKEWMPGLLFGMEKDFNRVHRLWIDPHVCM